MTRAITPEERGGRLRQGETPAPVVLEVAEEVDNLVQVNVRIPRTLRDAMDQRRRKVGSLSRDRWLANVIEWALRQPVGTLVVSPDDEPRRRRR